MQKLVNANRRGPRQRCGNAVAAAAGRNARLPTRDQGTQARRAAGVSADRALLTVSFREPLLDLTLMEGIHGLEPTWSR